MTMKSSGRGVALAAFVVMCGTALLSRAEPPQAQDRQTAAEWCRRHVLGELADAPWSLTVGGTPARALLAGWKRTSTTESLDAARVRHTVTHTDPATGLEVSCVAVEYLDFPAVEWTLHLRNGGDAVSPVVAALRPLDVGLDRKPGSAEFVLHHSKGSSSENDDYHPRRTPLDPRAAIELSCTGGRATNGTLPYFNVSHDDGGLVLAIGWPGQWDATFRRNDRFGLRIDGGQTDSRFVLQPGEQARSPLIVLLRYRGDWIDGQNLWRRWMVAHNLPRVGGELPQPQLLACSSHLFNEMINATEANQIACIDRYLEEKLPLMAWWMDAGWYVNDGRWTNTGTWEIDRRRFPNGFKPIIDHGHGRGVNSIVWFEPERVTRGTWLAEQHPDWLLTPPPNPGDQSYEETWGLLNLGNPEARAWLIQHVGDMIEQEGIDWYRQDFNVDPLLFWRTHDGPDRIGMTEMGHSVGYLAYWDALLKRHPRLRIDSCASGGRRNDLETLRRSVPLLRSDRLFEPISQQCHHFGIALWIPYHGSATHIGASAIGHTSQVTKLSYAFRSHMSPSLNACWDVRSKDLDYDLLRRLSAQFLAIAPNFLGDFYPLTDYSTADDAWMAWQYHRPEVGEGVVQAFRRGHAPEEFRKFRLRGLKPDSSYEIESLDSVDRFVRTGASLMHEGLPVHLPDADSAAVLVVRERPAESAAQPKAP